MSLPVRERSGVSAPRGLALVLSALLVGGGPALAAPEDVTAQRVEKLAAEALAAYKAADYNRTVELLERAYQIRQVAALLYNEAKAYEKLGAQDRAIELYRRYSDSSDADPKLRAKAEARVAAYEEMHRPRRDPGPGPGDDPQVRRRDPGPDPRLEAEAQARKGAEDAQARRLAEWQHRRTRARGTGGALVGVGLACAIAAIGLSVSATRLHGDFASELGTEAAKRSERDSAKTQALAGDVLYGVAAVGVAAGAYFLWRGYRREEAPRISSIGPVLTPSSASLVVGGVF